MPLRSVLGTEDGGSFYVYALFRPWNGTPCYVGKGKGRRAFEHSRLGERHYNRHLANIFMKSAKLGLEVPVVIVRDALSMNSALDLEVLLIQVVGRGPGRLVNMTAGGDGARDRDLILNHEHSLKVKARFADLEERQRQSDRTRQYFAQPGAKERHSKRQRERLSDPKTREKMRIARLGKSTPREIVEKQRLGNIRSWDNNPQRREYTRQVQLSRYESLEERRRTGEAIKNGQTVEGRNRTIEATKRRWIDPDKRRSFYEKMKGNQHSKGRVWINNGTERRMVFPDEVPEGWQRGKSL